MSFGETFEDYYARLKAMVAAGKQVEEVPLTPETLGEEIRVEDQPTPVRLRALAAAPAHLQWLVENLNRSDQAYELGLRLKNGVRDAEEVLRLISEPRWRARDLEKCMQAMEVRLVRARTEHEQRDKAAAVAKEEARLARSDATAARADLKQTQKAIAKAKARLGLIEARCAAVERKAQAATKRARKVKVALGELDA